MSAVQVPFHRATMTGNEKKYLEQALQEGQFSGNGAFTKRCEEFLKRYSDRETLLVTSGTTAIDFASLVLDLKPGDEVIMPSFTFVATASGVALRGAVPVFIDVRPDTLNIDEKQIERAITPRTKAIFPIHYGGVGAEMDAILPIARAHRLRVVEDSAQCYQAFYKGKPLGTLGHLGTLSFHATKNLHCGEGGAVFINDPKLLSKAEIVREKGTNRSQFFRGEVDKYTWVDLGSAFCPSELDAAFLLAQLEQADEITKRRLQVWNTYHRELKPLVDRGYFRMAQLPTYCEHNGHICFVVLPNNEARHALFAFAKERGVGLSSHYVPLHSSPAGEKFGRVGSTMHETNAAFEGLLRLPLWDGVSEKQNLVLEVIHDWCRQYAK